MRRFNTYWLFLVMVLGEIAMAQTADGKREMRPLVSRSQFQSGEKTESETIEEFVSWKRERLIRIRERLATGDIQEREINPSEYRVGPGDALSLDVWGTMVLQIPLIVSPQGDLFIPSVGVFNTTDKTLLQLQNEVVQRAESIYKNSQIALTLQTLRFFRLHVVGEVRFPGTYIAQAVNRFSDLIQEAGYVTQWADRNRIEIRRLDGSVVLFDLDKFEHKGDNLENLFVRGGDVIYVPPLNLTGEIVQVDGDLENAGGYPLLPGETLLQFLTRIRVLEKGSDFVHIQVLRRSSPGQPFRLYAPFSDTSKTSDFLLQGRDRIVIPSQFVYVKGAVQLPGAYPFALRLTAKDYVGMAGSDYRAGKLRNITVWHAATGRKQKGPDVVVEPGDVVEMGISWSQVLDVFVRIIPTITSLILAAKAAGLFGE